MKISATRFWEKHNLDAHFFSVALLVGLLLPHSGALYFVNPVVVLLLAWRYSRIEQLNGLKAIIILGMAFSALAYVLFQNQLSGKEIFRSVYLLMMLGLFPFAKHVRVPDIYLFFGMGYIVLSQLSWVIGFRPLIEFFVNFYPYEGDIRIYQTDFLLDRAQDISMVYGNLRLGGMYHNPNQYAKYLEIIYAVFLIDSPKSYKFKMFLSTAMFVPILYSGSRTGLVVVSLLALGYTYVQYREVPAARKLLLLLGGIVMFGFAFILIRDIIASGSVRVLDFQEGIERSLLPKWSFFQAYLDVNPGVFEIFFGTFDISLVGQYTSDFGLMDSEWGNAFFAYGFVFCIMIIFYYSVIYRRFRPDAKIVFILFLWMVSSTMLFSYRASFLIMLLLSKYYVDTKRSGSKNNVPKMTPKIL